MISGVDLDRRRIRGFVNTASAGEDRLSRLAEVPADALVAAILDAREREPLTVHDLLFYWQDQLAP
jgi:hypothetical protein